MAVYEISFWNGDIEEVEADGIGEAKKLAEELNPGIGVKCAILIDDDDEDVEDNPGTDEADAEESAK